jgi:hypothetical protein
MMDQLIPFHKPNTKSEEWEEDGPPHSSNQTHHKMLKQVFWQFPATYDKQQIVIYLIWALPMQMSNEILIF